MIMTVRTFAMSKSLSGALSTVEPPSSNTDFSSTQNDTQNHSHPQRESLGFEESGSHKPGITFAGQDKLPKLPIPELESTCRKYLDALKALQNSHEQEETEGAVHEFLQNEGPELQVRLKKYATGKTSYLEQFCKLVMPWNGDCSQPTDSLERSTRRKLTSYPRV